MESRIADQFGGYFVRIRTAEGAVVGAGFLVAERHIVTCAHVVATALGIPDDAFETPLGAVQLDFPFHQDDSGNTVPYTAHVVHWQVPAGPSTNPSGDIAVLRLDTPPPDATLPALLTLANRSLGRDIRAYGFPKGYDVGLFAYGVVRHTLSNGWLQVEDTKGPGRRIEEGFSGGPVEDLETGSIVGMVVASTKNKVDKVGFVIPSNILARAWPSLNILVQEHRDRGSAATANVANISYGDVLPQHIDPETQVA